MPRTQHAMTSLDKTVTLLQTLGDPSRVRLLTLLSHHELSVAELVAVTELTQSRVSSHLAKLREVGLLHAARDGAVGRYRVDLDGMAEPAKKLWAAVSGGLDDGKLARDRRRADEAVRARQSGSRWSERVAGEMERHWSPGRTWESAARGFCQLLSLGDVLDVGSGDGTIAELIATRTKSITCIDRSEKVVTAASERLSPLANARALVGDATALPFDDESFDAVLLFHLLTLLPHPSRAVAEAARVLRPGGVVLVTTLDAHDRRDVVAPFEHVHMGFRPSVLRKMLGADGLIVESCELALHERRPPHLGVVIARASKGATRTAKRFHPRAASRRRASASPKAVPKGA